MANGKPRSPENEWITRKFSVSVSIIVQSDNSIPFQAEMQPRALAGWRLPSRELALAADEVHVWRLALRENAALLPEMRRLLSESERERADRFHFDRDRRQYTLTRGVLRTLLGKYLAMEPSHVCIRYSPRNKPLVEPRDNPLHLEFNISHAGDWSLLAFCRDREVGVDLESCQRLADWRAVAARIFSGREQRELDSLPAPQQQTAFFNGWTRKEAYLKATGDGLIDALDGIEVSLAPAAPACIRAIHGDVEAAKAWWIYPLEPADRFVAALAVKDGACVLQWHWVDSVLQQKTSAVNLPSGPGG